MPEWVRKNGKVERASDAMLDTISDLTHKRDRAINDMTEFALADPTLEAIMVILIARLR